MLAGSEARHTDHASSGHHRKAPKRQHASNGVAPSPAHTTNQ